jgi:predicted RNA-binding protein with PUA-like domain
MAKQFWLMKCEPSAYSIGELERDGTASWEGVRNYQARNYMRDGMKKGDLLLFYASNADPSGVTGVAKVVREAYPDDFALRKGHVYYDPKSTADNPIWCMVDVAFVERFPRTLPLDALRGEPALAKMMVLQKGSRLSVQPVTKEEFEVVVQMGRGSKF